MVECLSGGLYSKTIGKHLIFCRRGRAEADCCFGPFSTAACLGFERGAGLDTCRVPRVSGVRRNNHLIIDGATVE